MTNPLVLRSKYNKLPIKSDDGVVDVDWLTREHGKMEAALAFATSWASTVAIVDDFGADARGVNDSGPAFAAAIAASAVVVLKPGGRYRIASTVSVRRSVTVRGAGATIVMDFPAAATSQQGACFDVLADDVTFDAVTWTQPAGVTLTGGNRYLVRVDPPDATRYANLTVLDCTMTACRQYSGTIPATVNVTHGVLARQVDGVTVTGTSVDDISGSPVYLIDTTRADIARNRFSLFGWSGVWFNNANVAWSVTDNWFGGTTAAFPSYWGGAVDVMGQTADAVLPGTPDELGIIARNHFDGGVYRYGQVVRVASTNGVVITGNLFDQCDADDNSTPGAGPAGSRNNMILATVRDVSLNNGPHRNVVITNNIIRPKGAGWQVAIYAITTSGTDTNTTPCDGLIIADNEFLAVDASNFLQSAVVVHGFVAGYRNIRVAGNAISVVPYSVPNYQPATLPGAVVFIAESGAPVERVAVTGNTMTQYGAAGTTANDTAVTVFTDVDAVSIIGNTFTNFYRDVTVTPGNTGLVPISPNVHDPASGGAGWDQRGDVITPNWTIAYPGVVRSVTTSPVTVTTVDETILADATAGAMTVNLPAAATATVGKTYHIKKIDVSANAVTVDADGADLIDGAGTYPLGAQWESITVQSDGADWYIL